MTLSPIYQQWRTETLQQGKVELVLRQLIRKVGELDAETRSRIETLPLLVLEELGEALLDFSSAADLATWLLNHSG